MRALLTRFSWQELRHHPWRSAAAVVAVMLGVALALAVQLINASALSEFSAAAKSASGEPDAQLRGAAGRLDERWLELVQAQAQRLQSMSDELDTVRASLNERKLIERAKGLLMAHRQLSEDEAHKTMRQMAMNQNKRLIDVAEAVLAMADVLPARGR
jgi:hypothetical protein